MSFYCGIDISKLSFDARYRRGGEDKEAKLPHKKFPNTAAGFRALVEWVRSETRCRVKSIRIILEATGVYHRTAARAWHAMGCEVVIANPRVAHKFMEGLGFIHGTDKLAGEGLAYLGEHGRYHLWAPPPPEIDTLQAILARLAVNEKNWQAEKNRLEKTKHAQSPPAVVRSITEGLQHHEEQQKRLLRDIEELYAQYPRLAADRALLLTMPSVGEMTANYLLALIRSKPFTHARQVGAMSGLIPVIHDSGTSIHADKHISRRGPTKTRKMLYMSSVSGCVHNPRLVAVYKRLRGRGKSAKSAINALARKTVHIAFGILRSQIPFDPTRNINAPRTRRASSQRLRRQQRRRIAAAVHIAPAKRSGVAATRENPPDARPPRKLTRAKRRSMG
jgi:transposase